jgi:hypothetical protein
MFGALPCWRNSTRGAVATTECVRFNKCSYKLFTSSFKLRGIAFLLLCHEASVPLGARHIWVAYVPSADEERACLVHSKSDKGGALVPGAAGRRSSLGAPVDTGSTQAC